MPSIVWDDWKGGLDRRREVGMSAANVLYQLTNCYITTGKAIRKRPCFTKVGALTAGTVGLRSGGGKLVTFYGTGSAITHPDTTLFDAKRVPHWTSGAAPTKIHYAETFNGYLYVVAEYSAGVYRHHYLDDPGSWVAATNYSVGDFRRPTTANGFRYEVTADAGSSDASEPTWPTTIGTTVVDGGITWTCRTFAITDVNCPHSKQVVKIGQKIYAASGANVRFCAATDVRDWTTAGDAGFIPSGIHAAGSDTVTALGVYREKLTIYFSDSTQIWQVAADPDSNALVTNAPNIGTIHSKTPHVFADDLMFLSKPGFRSVSIAVLTQSIAENDIGSPIDELRDEVDDDDDPIAIFYPRLAQLWIVNLDVAFVITYSKSGKITAWSVFTFPFEITDVAILNNELYARAGNSVYRADRTVYADDGVPPYCLVETFFQDNKQPAILKQFLGFDTVVKGSPTVSWKYDPRNTDLVSAPTTMTGDTRPGDVLPMELCATSVAAVFEHEANEEFQISHLQAHYENLGAV